jgi:hypothetical protein
MFDDVLIESAGTVRTQGTRITALISGVGGVISGQTGGTGGRPVPVGGNVQVSIAVKTSGQRRGGAPRRACSTQPGTLHGKPVPVSYNLTVNFRIE